MNQKFDDARLDEIMEQYKEQLVQFQRARRDVGSGPQYEQQVTLTPVDYHKMSDAEIFSQPAIPLSELMEEFLPSEPTLPMEELIEEVISPMETPAVEELAEEVTPPIETLAIEEVVPPTMLPIQGVGGNMSPLMSVANPSLIDCLIEKNFEQMQAIVEQQAAQEGASSIEEGEAISMMAVTDALLPALSTERVTQAEPVVSAVPEIDLTGLLVQNTAPRLMFAKGCGAFGAFKPYQSFGDICAAPFLQSLSPLGVFARFSGDVLPGDADARRCQRGLLLRIYDGKKSYDLVFTHLPLTLLANPDLMPKLMQAMKPNSIGLRSSAPLWQFVAEHNEALQGMLWLNSDLGTAPSYRTISYYSMPLFLVDANGERRLCKLRLSPRASANPLTRFEAEELCGCDPDALTRDLNIALGQNEGVVFELSAQVIDEEALAELDFDPLDPTIPWRLSRFPIVTLGEVLLSRQVDDYNTQVERMTIDFTSPTGVEYPTGSLYAAMSRAAPQAQYYRTGAQNSSTPTLFASDPWKVPHSAETPLDRVGQWLDQMSQREKKRLIDNLAEELSCLDAELLEQVLLLLTRADLPFGKALALALEGV